MRLRLLPNGFNRIGKINKGSVSVYGNFVTGVTAGFINIRGSRKLMFSVYRFSQPDLSCWPGFGPPASNPGTGS
ncbi:hypothetical protein [Autumnicola musiva]|uniref:Uncharacterized protein n=1 Tax=Autumnicola musiva TaxID=3075589 RepID=A0ABU3D199_9FLAO|nr:hypothetical protein [Zunongwangia sp. F117]MDT0675186.1 hypothetical protein [Zunongwangia sp. F117]